MTPASLPADPTLSILEAQVSLLGQDPSKLTTMLGTDPNHLNPQRDQLQGIFGVPFHKKANGDRFSSRDYVMETINEVNINGSRKHPLTLLENALATRVLFSNATTCGKPQATGIEILRGMSMYKADPRYKSNNKGTWIQARARKEVILSGGSFNSPQLLMLSGIGPAEELKKFNISVLVDLPGVGRNLMDNQEMPIVGQPKTGESPQSGQGSEGGVLLKTKHAVYDERDMFLIQGLRVLRGFWPDNHTNLALPVDTGKYGISMVKMHPQNHQGTIKLKSADPQDPPDIIFNLYAEGNEIDMGAMKDTIAWARKVFANTKAPAGPVTALEPPCPNGSYADGSCDADEDWIIAQTFGHHPTGTCALGGNNDKMAVVDSRFRVRGVSGLRIVDASIYPRPPGAFPVVATFMISEKASDIVLEDARKPDQC